MAEALEVSGNIDLGELAIGYKGDTGAQGYGIVASVPRDNFAESDWTAYGTIGHVGNWSGTESTRNGCRIGDLFIVVGTATDSGNAHTLVYRSDTDSGTLHGECIAHTYAKSASESAAKADAAATKADTAASEASTQAGLANDAAELANDAASSANASASKADTATKSAIDAASSATAAASKADAAAANVKDGKRGNRIYYSSYADSANQEGAYFSDFTPAASAVDPPMVGDLVVQSQGYILEITSVTIDNDSNKHGGFVGMGPYLGNIKGAKGDKGDFTPTTAQIAAMNSGLDAKFHHIYKIDLSDKIQNRTHGSFIIYRVGRMCVAQWSDLGASTEIKPLTKYRSAIPDGFSAPSGTSFIGYRGFCIYGSPRGSATSFRTGGYAINSNSWESDFVVYPCNHEFPDDAYIIYQ